MFTLSTEAARITIDANGHLAELAGNGDELSF